MDRSTPEPSTLSQTAAERIGQSVDGRYRIEGVLGIGGLGVVYRAEHVALRRFVALKVMHDVFADHEELRRRFEREARALSALDHTNIVAITDFGMHDGAPYLAMALIEGESLAQRLARGPVPVNEAVVIVGQVLDALAAAHAAGIVHRDLKPGNIMLEVWPDGAIRTRIVDFGLAKLAEPLAESAPDATLTQMGTVIGSPSYMAPEQTAAESVDERADLYALGVVFYEMLVGRCPFVNDDKLDTVRAHLTEEVPRPDVLRPGLTLSPALDALLRRSLAKARDDRFESAVAMRAALDALPLPAATFAPPHPSGPADGSGPAPARGPGHRAPAHPPSRPGIPGPILMAALGLGALGALGLFVIAALVIARADSADDAVHEPDDGFFSGDGMMAIDEEELPALDGRPRPYDPLRGEIPEEILGPFALVRGGGQLDRAQQRVLQGYQHQHPDDARPALILARDYTRRNWYRDALPRYQQAYRTDPGVRGSPWMREDLLRMLSAPSYGDRAAQLLHRIYGREILPDIQARLIEGGDLDDREHRRLERLLRRLE